MPVFDYAFSFTVAFQADTNPGLFVFFLTENPRINKIHRLHFKTKQVRIDKVSAEKERMLV